MSEDANPAVAGQVERRVGRAAWEHLKPYGYAPGNYMGKCHECGKVWDDQDKRAWTCRECAEKTHAEALADAEAYSKPPCQECGAMTLEEAQERCICSGDKDDCHGTKLWPD